MDFKNILKEIYPYEGSMTIISDSAMDICVGTYFTMYKILPTWFSYCERGATSFSPTYYILNIHGFTRDKNFLKNLYESTTDNKKYVYMLEGGARWNALKELPVKTFNDCIIEENVFQSLDYVFDFIMSRLYTTNIILVDVVIFYCQGLQVLEKHHALLQLQINITKTFILRTQKQLVKTR